MGIAGLFCIVRNQPGVTGFLHSWDSAFTAQDSYTPGGKVPLVSSFCCRYEFHFLIRLLSFAIYVIFS